MSSEAFTLPKEFEGFVSDSDSLLKQFERLDIEDAVTISIYPDPSPNGNFLTLPDLCALLDGLTAAIDEISKSYIWFKDSLKLYLIVPNNKNGKNNKNDRSTPPYFTGTVKFLDSIEDEWFITYIAFKLSELHKNVSISCTDTDGQFLLIEAADFIPDWIDPENCENRLWIRNCKMHIISLDEPGRNKYDSGIKLCTALEIVRSRPSDTIVSRQVQAAIEQRTTLAYPIKAIAETHVAYCTLARTIAELFQASPELISIAINAFCLPQAAGSNKNYIAVMQKFGSNLTDLVTIPIRFTRLQYAKIMYQTFHVPKKFHLSMRIVREADSIILNKSFELGCRLSCGLESAYQRNKNDINSIIQMEVNLRKELKLQGLEKYNSSIYKDNSNTCKIIDNILLTNKNNSEDNNDKNNNQSNNNKNENLDEIKISKNLLNNFKLCEKNIPQDSDSWLFMSPEEMDKEMERKVKSITAKFESDNNSDEKKEGKEGKKGKQDGVKDTNIDNNIQNVQNKQKNNDNHGDNNSDHNSDNISDNNSDNKGIKVINKIDNKGIQKMKNKDNMSEADQLDIMLKGMKIFLGGKSGIDGIGSDSKPSTKTKSGKTSTKLVPEAASIPPTLKKSFNSTLNTTSYDTSSEENGTPNTDKTNLTNDNNDNNSNDNSNGDNNGIDKNSIDDSIDNSKGIEIDFDKLMNLLNTTPPSASAPLASSAPSEHSSAIKQRKDHSLEIKESMEHYSENENIPQGKDTSLRDYFYENDINEFDSSDDDSDDSDDNDDNNNINDNDEEEINGIINSNVSDENRKVSSAISGVKVLNFLNNNSSNSSSVKKCKNDMELISNIKKLMISNNNGNNLVNNLESGSSSNRSEVLSEEDNDADDGDNSDDEVVGVGSTGNNKGDSNIDQNKDNSGKCNDNANNGSSNKCDHNNKDVNDGDDDSFYDSSEIDSDDEIDEEAIQQKVERNNRNNNRNNSRNNNSHYDRSNRNNDKDNDEDIFEKEEVSDNDNEDEDDEEDERLFREEYEQSMDRELASSTLVESFERYKTDADRNSYNDNDEDNNDKADSYSENPENPKNPEAVNVDLNFLKYLLESHASQLGSAGPATQLFSQLGIKLPNLPPMNSKPEE